MNTTRKLAVLAAVAVTYMAVALPDADAHTPTVQATCTTLTVELTRYEPGTTVKVTIDTTVTSKRFDSDLALSFPLDPTRDHTYSVVVDNKGDGLGRDEWDRTFTGATTACVAPTTTTAPPTTTTAPPPPPAVAPVIVHPEVTREVPELVPAPVPTEVLAETAVAAPIVTPRIAFTG